MSEERRIEIVALGRMPYRDAYALQERAVEAVLASRPSRRIGTILVVEHDPVVTVSRRGEATGNLLATPEFLRSAGIDVQPTDRGGDITYHGPGQLVLYPVLDMEALRIRIGDYLRMLENAVMACCSDWGLSTMRDESATGVWTVSKQDSRPEGKICAIGVRVRRWVTMHGLALNVATDLSHFGHIVPCGLVGRPVTSLSRELGDAAPTLEEAAAAVPSRLRAMLLDWAEEHEGHAARRDTIEPLNRAARNGD